MDKTLLKLFLSFFSKIKCFVKYFVNVVNTMLMLKLLKILFIIVVYNLIYIC